MVSEKSPNILIHMSPQEVLQNLLARADIKIHGSRPWDLNIRNNGFYKRVLTQGSLGLGESYMDGWWDCERIDELINRIVRVRLDQQIKPLHALVLYLRARMFNLQSYSRAFEIGERHYDVGNDLYQVMLDKRMTYTCGYWKNASNLDDAQEAKLDLVCRKIGLKKGMTVLDIGCGWGSFARFAAEKYGVRVTGITVSEEQIALGEKMCAGLPVELIFQDYRDLVQKSIRSHSGSIREKQFDRVVSLGMFEHVGSKNYSSFMNVAHRVLKDDGIFLLHTIGGNHSTSSTDPWIEKYIFPNSMLPSIKQVGASIERRFVVEDLHNFGADYDKTLLAWFQHVETGWHKLQKKYNKRFFRTWKFYLLSCAGMFRARELQLWQIVLTKRGIVGGYHSIR